MFNPVSNMLGTRNGIVFYVTTHLFKFYYQQMLRKTYYVVTKLNKKQYFCMNLENDGRWNRRCTTINRRYFEKQLLRNSKDNMLCNSISVDMKVYALQLKQKSTANVFHGILRNFRKILSRIIFGGCFWKENKRPSRCAVNLWFQLFTFSRAVVRESWNNLFPKNFA